MPAEARSVSDLVAQFQLRRRAPSEAFAAGVRLARAGAVVLEDVGVGEVSGVVHDPEPLFVRIVADDGDLVGVCACSPADAICRHQVAVAHELWVRDRQSAN